MSTPLYLLGSIGRNFMNSDMGEQKPGEKNWLKSDRGRGSSYEDMSRLSMSFICQLMHNRVVLKEY